MAAIKPRTCPNIATNVGGQALVYLEPVLVKPGEWIAQAVMVCTTDVWSATASTAFEACRKLRVGSTDDPASRIILDWLERQGWSFLTLEDAEQAIEAASRG